MLPVKEMPCFTIFEDNQGADHSRKTRYRTQNGSIMTLVAIFFRELVRRQEDISVSHAPAEYQHADILTRALAFDVFAIHRRFLTNLSV